MPVLDYQQPRPEPQNLWWHSLVWLTPVWCAGILGLHWIFGGGDDPYWFAAMGLAALLGAICFVKRQKRLAVYCFAVLVLLLLIAVLLPTFNRAT